jgi:hypothetical protein
MGYITRDQLAGLASRLGSGSYGSYLARLAAED